MKYIKIDDYFVPHAAAAINIAQASRLYHWFAHCSRSLKKMKRAAVTAHTAITTAVIIIGSLFFRIKKLTATCPIFF